MGNISRRSIPRLLESLSCSLEHGARQAFPPFLMNLKTAPLDVLKWLW
jgi:hypothetical protein